MQNFHSDGQFIEFVDDQGKIVTLPLHKFLQKKEEEARRQDQALGIKRARIPAVFIELPDVPESIDFQKLANAIHKVSACEYIAPENHDQGVWLRCIQSYWNAKSIVFANKIYKLIPDPVQPGGPVQENLPRKTLENLKLDVEAELAWYNLLRFGETEIRTWAETEEIYYPFSDCEQLFIETLRVSFEFSLTDEIFAPFPLNPNRKQERDHYRGWLQFLSGNFLDRPGKQKEYSNVLRSMDWKGYALLALQDAWNKPELESRDKKRYKLLEKLWRDYIKKQRPLLKFLDSRIYWKDGRPYQSRRTDNGRRIKTREPIESTVTEAYFDWKWLNDT